MLILCLEYQSRSFVHVTQSRHKPFLLVNNSIIQDVYFNAFYCYSRNFRAIKSWSCIYCGSSDIYCDPCVGSRMHTGENTRCRKSVNLTIIIIFLGTLKLKKLINKKTQFEKGKNKNLSVQRRYNIYM